MIRRRGYSSACRNGPGRSTSKSTASPWSSLPRQPLLARALHAHLVGDLALAPRQRHHRHRNDALDDACDVVEVALSFRQFCQPLAVADGLVCHGEREMQRPIEFDLAAI